MRYVFVFILFFFVALSYGQDSTTICIDRVTVRRPSPLVVGVEQDVLPYILKGYIATAWIGRDFFRYRFSYAQAETPSFTHGEGIDIDRVNAFGLSFEYFFRENYKGLWLGPGIGYWTNYIKADDGTKGKNESLIFSLGGGYNYFLNRWLYVTPWVALHTRVSGHDKIEVGSATYKPAIVTPEMSVKIGVRFPCK